MKSLVNQQVSIIDESHNLCYLCEDLHAEWQSVNICQHNVFKKSVSVYSNSLSALIHWVEQISIIILIVTACLFHLISLSFIEFYICEIQSVLFKQISETQLLLIELYSSCLWSENSSVNSNITCLETCYKYICNNIKINNFYCFLNTEFQT